MNHHTIFIFGLVLLGLLCVGFTRAGRLTGPPTLKWKNAGCVTGGGIWCEHGYYASPYIGDFDKDGKIDIIFASYIIANINGTTGATKWSFKTGKQVGLGGGDIGRTWELAVDDLDGDGKNELITIHQQGYIVVYNDQGKYVTGYPKQFGTDELRSLTIADVNQDGKREIIIASSGSPGDSGLSLGNTWILNKNGTNFNANWPQKRSSTKGVSSGIYNHNVAIYDMVPGGPKEIVAPSDVHYIMVYNSNGAPIAANPKYKYPNGSLKTWGEAGVYTKLADEIVGFGNCSAGAGTTRPNFGPSRTVWTDIDGNGKAELMVVGNVYDCGGDDTNYLYYGPFILNGDRTRWSPAVNRNWTNVPINTGRRLYPVNRYDIIEDCQPNVVAADIDGDGIREMLFPSYSGRMLVYWADKTQKYNWTRLNLDGEYPTEPLIVDFENDGKAEVIFATFPKKESGKYGKLYVTDYKGNVLYKISLPAPAPENSNWNGVLAAPTIGNIDNDADLEIVLNTWNTGLVAYDLPGSAGARKIWTTGSLNYQRNPDEFSASVSRCNTCWNQCYTQQSCGTNVTCQNNCKLSCKTSRQCF